MFDIQIIPAKIEQQPVIKQLLELYTYKMTDLADFDIHDNGYFGYDDLPLRIDYQGHTGLLIYKFNSGSK
jgi:hypothetical protein